MWYLESLAGNIFLSSLEEAPFEHVPPDEDWKMIFNGGKDERRKNSISFAHVYSCLVAVKFTVKLNWL